MSFSESERNRIMTELPQRRAAHGIGAALVVRERAVPMGRLAIIAQRAAVAARRWLETQA